MKILEKINFRQPKYMLPVHPFISPCSASFLFHLRPVSDRNDRNTRQGVADDGVPEPELPGAQIKDDGIGSKYENMQNHGVRYKTTRCR